MLVLVGRPFPRLIFPPPRSGVSPACANPVRDGSSPSVAVRPAPPQPAGRAVGAHADWPGQIRARGDRVPTARRRVKAGPGVRPGPVCTQSAARTARLARGHRSRPPATPHHPARRYPMTARRCTTGRRQASPGSGDGERALSMLVSTRSAWATFPPAAFARHPTPPAWLHADSACMTNKTCRINGTSRGAVLGRAEAACGDPGHQPPTVAARSAGRRGVGVDELRDPGWPTACRPATRPPLPGRRWPI